MHQHISSNERYWLPAKSGLLAPHPACRECGYIKNISSDKTKKVGYYINILAEMKNFKGIKLSDAQIRLIVSELQKIEDFEDAYYMTFTIQKYIFINAVRKYSNLSMSFIEAFLN